MKGGRQYAHRNIFDIKDGKWPPNHKKTSAKDRIATISTSAESEPISLP